MRKRLRELLLECGAWGANMTTSGIANHLIANDVVPVVRCNECKNRGNMACPLYNEEYVPMDYDGYDEGEWVITDNTCDDGFCDKGERREEE